MKVIGVRVVRFPDKNDATKEVSGVKVFCTRPITENGEGEFFYSDDAFFLNDWMLKNRCGGHVPRVGDEIDIRFNRQGKVQEVVLLSPAD